MFDKGETSDIDHACLKKDLKNVPEQKNKFKVPFNEYIILLVIQF